MENKNINLLPPGIRATSGDVFEVTPTEEDGVFSTWSGDNKNFGYGMTTYIAYTYSKDGNNVYYSDSRTGYKIKIEEEGTYTLQVAGEKDHIAHNGKEIPGFTTALLTLPEGKNSWIDDGCGTITAVFDETAEKLPEQTPTVYAESLKDLPKEEQEEMKKAVEYYLGSEEATEKDYYTGEVNYKTVYGTRVREIHVPAVKKGIKTTIAALADLHMNHVTELDRDDAEIQYTNKTRHWGRNGSLTPRGMRGLAFSDMFDQTVIAGDILDYQSYGAAKAVRDHIIKPYPQIMMTIGGHDVTRNMETGYPDRIPLAYRQAFLQAFWPHDLFYYSKLVNDSVLLIAMDNGLGRYSEEQLEKFSADIEKARKNDYTVLIFQHEPIASRDEKYTETNCMDPCNDPVKTVFNYCDAKQIGGIGRSDSEITKAVYELIVNSADVIKAVVAGHRHYNYFIEMPAKTSDGKDCVIPQYVIRASAYDEYGNVALFVIE